MTLTIDGLTYAYGKTQILHDVSLTVPRGQLIGLLGPNGSGKSTLIKVIARINRLQSGRITLDDRPLSGLRAKEHAKLVSYVPQAGEASAALSVRDCVLLGRTPYFGMRPAESDWAAVDDAIELFNLTELADRPMADLSGGQAQRVLIARATAQDPQVLLLDEPTSALDLRYQVEALRLLRALTHDRNLVTIIAIHDLNLASRFCDQVAVLSGGRIAEFGTTQQAYRKDLLEQVYGLPVDVHSRGPFVEVQPVTA
ncbi:ABC transporter ATP-binding protein [Mycolicibacterium sp.]|uniref:ABC transporter ATP-binding protein n=1 Tax=Mycolicibacterium sp. TaxID=2320850 RepID=UPI003D1442C7